jgi:hypothetical protein
VSRPKTVEQAARIRLLEGVLEAICVRHKPRPGIDGTGLACAECGHLAPCPTVRLAKVDPGHVVVEGEVLVASQA